MFLESYLDEFVEVSLQLSKTIKIQRKKTTIIA
jgi:hypothetical protein